MLREFQDMGTQYKLIYLRNKEKNPNIWDLKEHMALTFLVHPREMVIFEGQGF